MTLTDSMIRAWAAFEREDWTQAEALYQGILSDPALTSVESREARFCLGYVLAHVQHFDEAREIFASLREQAAAGDDLASEHVALHQVGMVERIAGHWQAAQECFECERELIARQPHPTDGRAMGLHLTEAGARLMRAAERTAAQLEAEVAARLTATESKTLIRLLKKVYLPA